ncbi:MAG: pilus assembly protein [Chloroflexi bacterium]|nr:pilus assembly protein [Chloroflexota bacterium]
MAVLLWLLIFGIVELGRIVFAYNSVASIAREGARYGIIHPNNTAGVENAARALSTALDPALLDIDVTWGGGAVNVVASYPLNLIPGLFIQAIGGSSTITLRAEATMRMEQ